MTQIANIISELVDALETMALQYLSDLDMIWLEAEREVDSKCLEVLEKLGKLEKTEEGFYTWTKQSENHKDNPCSNYIFLVKELPLTLTQQEVITALVGMAKEYLTYGNESWMTHNLMSAGEQTLDILRRLGIVKTEDDVT